MTERRITQVIVSDLTWARMPGIRERCETTLRKNLEADGCHDIVIEEPTHKTIPAVEEQPEWWDEEEVRWEPIQARGAWEIVATGEHRG